jgi:hypothetical protein
VPGLCDLEPELLLGVGARVLQLRQPQLQPEFLLLPAPRTKTLSTLSPLIRVFAVQAGVLLCEPATCKLELEG